MIKRPRRAQRQNLPVFTAGIGMLSARADLTNQLAVEAVDQRHVVRLIGQVDHVVHDLEAMRALEQARAPGAEKFSVLVEDQHRRVLALKNIQTVLRIRGHPADQADGFACGHFGKVFNEFVGVWACADFHHRSPASKLGAILHFSTHACHSFQAWLRHCCKN